jgi:hypothetical protein
MMRTTTRFSGSFLLLFAAAAIIGVYFYYFFFIVKEREEKIIARGYRVLENINRNIHEKKLNYEQGISFPNPEITIVESSRFGRYFKNDGYFTFSDSLKQYAYFKKFPAPQSDLLGGLISVDNFFKGVRYDDFYSNLTVFDDTATFYNSSLSGLTLHTADTLYRLANENIGPFYFESSYGATKYLVFVKRLSFGEKSIYLAGFLDKHVFLSKSRQFNPYVLFAGSVLLIFLIVCLPLLKLWLINKYEQIQMWDAVRSAISIIFGGSLLTLLAMSMQNYLIVDKKQINDNLRHFGDNLHHKFTSEINTILYQLQNFPVDSLITDPKLLTDSTWAYHPDKISAFLTYPNLNEILFIDTLGYISQFVSYENDRKNFVWRRFNLSKRDYFSRVNEGHAWSYPGLNNSEIYIQSIYSWLKASGEAAISISSSALNHANYTFKNSMSVVALTSPLSSVMNTVVPDGYGFVIIDKTGMVQFHSTSRKNLMENFIDETDNNPKLKAAITHHQDEYFRIYYNDSQYRARIMPVQDLPFFIVVFYDLQFSRENSSRVIITSFELILVTTMVLIVVFLITWLYRTITGDYANGESVLDWLRYHSSRESLYFSQTCLNLAFLSLQIIFYFNSNSLGETLIFNILVVTFISLHSNIILRFLNVKTRDNTIWLKISTHYFLLSAIVVVLAIVEDILLLLLFPGAGILLLLLLYRLGDIKRPHWFKGLNCYSLFIFIWICSISVIPAINLFKVIQQDEAGLWLRSMQFSLYRDYLQRNDYQEATFQSEKRNAKKRDYGQKEGIYDSFVYGSTVDFTDRIKVPEKTDLLIDSIDAEIYELTRPVISGYHEELRGLIHGLAADKKWSWQKLDINEDPILSKGEYLLFREKASTESDTFTVISTLPRFHLPSIKNYRGIIFWCLFVVALGIGYFIVHHSLDQIFHLKFLFGLKRKACAYTMKELLSKNKKLIIEGFQKAAIIHDIEQALSGENLIKISGEDILTETKLNKILKTGSAVLVTDFNYGVGVSNFNDYRLLLMRLLNRADNTTIVHIENGLVAFFDPPASAEKKIKKTDVSEKTEVESLEWLFTDFVSVVYPGDFEVGDTGSKKDYTKPQEADDYAELLARSNSGYYTHVWNCLNGAEKLVMFDLEKNSIINTSNQAVVEGMLRKGLLKDSDEKLQLADIGWTAFLKGNEQLNEFKQLKHSLRLSGNWHNWRLIIFAVILALCVLLFFSDKEFFSTLNGVIGGAAALIPLLFKLFESRARTEE